MLRGTGPLVGRPSKARRFGALTSEFASFGSLAAFPLTFWGWGSRPLLAWQHRRSPPFFFGGESGAADRVKHSLAGLRLFQDAFLVEPVQP